MNTVYWGVGVGITDLSYRSKVFYGESLGGALIPDQSGNNTMTGAAYYRLDNEKSISGTGFNFKFRCNREAHKRTAFRCCDPYPHMV